MSNPQRPHVLQPTRLLRPWDLPGKSTEVVAIAFSDKYCILTHIYMESEEMALMNLFSGQQKRNRHRELTHGQGGGRRGRRGEASTLEA